MIAAIKHWSQLCKIIEPTENLGQYRPTEIGKFLFDEESGVDPYLEDISTIWLMHWIISTNSEHATTWYYALNHFNSRIFDREQLSGALLELCKGLKKANASPATLKRDVECFVRTYISRAGAATVDDQVECLLGELNLIREVTTRSFEFQRGGKPALSDGVFAFALAEFWISRAEEQNTLSVEAITYEPGSPGRVFKLDENSIIDRLLNIERISEGAFVWTDTSGVRNIARRNTYIDKMDLLRLAFSNRSDRAAAA
jgi:hypothetical protein